MKNIKLIKTTIILLVTTVLFTACEDQQKNKLDNRVLDFWKYKIERNFEEAYEFLSPGWKSNESQASFVVRMNQSRIKWTNVSLKDKKCSQENLCKIKVSISYEYLFKGSGGKAMHVETTLKENWLMKKNIWYNVPIKSKMGQK